METRAFDALRVEFWTDRNPSSAAFSGGWVADTARARLELLTR